MGLCEKEGNDQGFLCCFGSYWGVITFGILQAIAFVLSVTYLIQNKPLVEASEDGEDVEISLKFYFDLFLLIITLIGLISFIVNLIW